MASSFCAWRRLSSRRSRSSSVCLSIEMSVMQPSQPANACVGVIQRRRVDEDVQLVALGILDRRFPAFDRALARHQVEEVRALAGLEQQVEEVDLVERNALARQQFHAGGIRGLEYAILLAVNKRHRHVVEQVLVAARGAHQVAMEIVALHRIGNDAREHAGVDAALLEVVLRAFAHGDESLLVVVGPGEHDDRREVGDGAQRAQRLQAGGVRQPESSSTRSYSSFCRRCGRFGCGLHPVADDFVESGSLRWRSTTRASAGSSSTNNNRMFLISNSLVLIGAFLTRGLRDD